jgi:4-oxalocrotonate tautomerase
MPFVRLSLKKGKPTAYRHAIAESVNLSLQEAFGTSPNDKFVAIHELDDENLLFDSGYLGISRTDEIVIIQIFANKGRDLTKKQALYAAVAKNLKESPGIRPEDVLINIVEVAKDDWSLGNGLAQYAPAD